MTINTVDNETQYPGAYFEAKLESGTGYSLRDPSRREVLVFVGEIDRNPGRSSLPLVVMSTSTPLVTEGENCNYQIYL